jgi:hypothetical protein
MSPLMSRENWAVRAALGTALAIVALSIFLVVIGSQYSEGSVTRQCSIGSQCIETQQFRNYFVPEPIAGVPLLIGMVVALGLGTKRMLLAWSGTISLLVFSFLSIFSIGLFYAPFAITLVGLLAVIQNHKSDSTMT